jgi:hypothetical protein
MIHLNFFVGNFMLLSAAKIYQMLKSQMNNDSEMTQMNDDSERIPKEQFLPKLGTILVFVWKD